MYRVIEYISENLSEDIKLKEMAHTLNYEYHYFSTLFHKCFCINFKSFINIFRFDAACKLLGDGAETITDVCNKCGFGSIRNFNRVFKQLGGITPGEYRKNVMK
ncbi:MAG: helix-turn-helix transcriptional regulator [Clostridia bacterium]|nr:helix-turn-helix transcriptional regulator [Clostridia bacterium]